MKVQLKYRFAFFVSTFILTSCLKEEIPVEPMDRGNSESNQIEMGSNYDKQIWFDFSTNSIRAISDKDAWDISFSCDANEDYIYLNGALFANAAITEFSDFELVNEDVADIADYRYDHHSGKTDSLAIGNWWEHQKVIVIDRGYDAEGNMLGSLKIQFIGEENGTYSFRYADLDGDHEHNATVVKNPLYNVIGFSFTTNQSLIVEPPKTDWDICFTQYVHMFYDPYTPYLVTGVLINRSMTEGAHLPNTSFADINSGIVESIDLITDLNVIGYEWKFYDFDLATYVVDPAQCYIISDSDGFMYKFHFIDFYNEEGVKGSPLFEFQLL